MANGNPESEGASPKQGLKQDLAGEGARCYTSLRNAAQAFNLYRVVAGVYGMEFTPL